MASFLLFSLQEFHEMAPFSTMSFVTSARLDLFHRIEEPIFPFLLLFFVCVCVKLPNLSMCKRRLTKYQIKS